MQPDLTGSDVALLTLSHTGLKTAEALQRAMPHATLYLHDDVPYAGEAKRFARVIACTEQIFADYRGLIYIMPAGVVVRAIAPHVVHKLSDPAVVVLDVMGRWAVSLLSGHEGGANDLTLHVANAIGAEPVISTSSEAEKDLIVGVGCRRGAEADAIEAAIRQALAGQELPLEKVRYIASADLKHDEAGLLEAAARLGLPLRFIAGEAIQESPREFTHSTFVKERVNLPSVSEACALLAGQRTELICPKQVIHHVTVAIARENSSS